METVNVNKAGVDELRKIIHIGTARALKLIHSRPYRDLHEISKILGLGKKRMEDIFKQGTAAV